MKEKTFPITTADARRELLKINAGTLRAVHDYFRIDYNKPHAILKMQPPSTRAAIRKAAAEAGYADALALVLIHRLPPENPARARCYFESDRIASRIFTIDAAGALDNPRKRDLPRTDKNAEKALDDCFVKGDFDDYRREPCAVYVILQNDADKTPAKTPGKPQPGTRYKVERDRSMWANGSGYDLRSIDGAEPVTVAPHTYYCNGKRNTETLADILDKSGYYIRDRRENLKRRANALRAERKKAAYNKTDTAADVEEVKTAANALRKAYADAISAADLATAAELIRFDYRPDRLKYAFIDAADYINAATMKAYKSQDAADKAKRAALDRIASAAATLAEIVKGGGTNAA